MQIEHDITKDLEQWGWWVQDCPMRSLHYKNTSGLMAVKSGIQLSITDERALEIDQAIAKLFNGNSKAIDAMKYRFVCGMGYRDIGIKLKISKDKAHSTIDSCVSWLTGYFYGYKNK